MKSIHVNYMLVCENVHEHEGGMVDFLKVFDVKPLKEIPTKLNFVLVINLEYSITDNDLNELKLRILNSENKILSKDLNIELRKESQTDHKVITNSMNVLRMANFPIDTSGEYKFQLIYNDKIIGNCGIMFLEEGSVK